MARYEGEYAVVSGGDVASNRLHRRDAIACVLSAGEGWRDAIRTLGGAFALGRKTGLIDGKDK